MVIGQVKNVEQGPARLSKGLHSLRFEVVVEQIQGQQPGVAGGNQLGSRGPQVVGAEVQDLQPRQLELGQNGLGVLVLEPAAGQLQDLQQGPLRHSHLMGEPSQAVCRNIQAVQQGPVRPGHCPQPLHCYVDRCDLQALQHGPERLWQGWKYLVFLLVILILIQQQGGQLWQLAL